MERKKHERFTPFIVAASIIAISAIGIIGAAPVVNAFIEPALAIGGMGCITYQTYPVQGACSMTIGTGTFTSV